MESVALLIRKCVRVSTLCSIMLKRSEVCQTFDIERTTSYYQMFDNFVTKGEEGVEHLACDKVPGCLAIITFV